MQSIIENPDYYSETFERVMAPWTEEPKSKQSDSTLPASFKKVCCRKDKGNLKIENCMWVSMGKSESRKTSKSSIVLIKSKDLPQSFNRVIGRKD